MSGEAQLPQSDDRRAALQTRSRLPLSYCTNVHAYSSYEGLRAVLAGPVEEVRRRSGFEGSFPLGLWWPHSLLAELESELEAFAAELAARDQHVVTLNVFPYGDFHSATVKAGVYRPSWWEEARSSYTLRAARLLARLLPEGATGTLSTVAGGYRPGSREPGRLEALAAGWGKLAWQLERLSRESGRELVLAVEPEPATTLESSQEVIDFYQGAVARAGVPELARAGGMQRGAAEELYRRRIGICFDTCHLAVGFESLPAALRSLEAAGIRLAKLQLSSALRVCPADEGAWQALLACAEPRYLHQTLARFADGRIEAALDLDQLPASFRQADELRTHFHVPLFFEQQGPLGSTQADLLAALACVPELRSRPHLEVETYTWHVLPESLRAEGVEAGVARELRWVAAQWAAKGGL